MSTCSADLRPGDSATAKGTKYTELIMKCLWKLAKTIQDNLRTGLLSADQLLLDINNFFINTPPTEWKRRANESVPLGEMPLRTVKTLLLELVNGLGDNIFQHLTLIDNPERSSVYPYLHHMLEACRKKDRLQQQQQQQEQHVPQQRSPLLSTQSIKPQQTEENANRFISHSRNSSLGRPGSVSSLKSNTMMRSPSMASYQSGADVDAPHNNSMENMSAASNQSPQLASLSLNNSNHQVQPMQVDEQPPSQQPAQDNTNGPQPLSDYESNNTLTRIFQKIGTRDQTKQVNEAIV